MTDPTHAKAILIGTALAIVALVAGVRWLLNAADKDYNERQRLAQEAMRTPPKTLGNVPSSPVGPATVTITFANGSTVHLKANKRGYYGSAKAAPRRRSPATKRGKR